MLLHALEIRRLLRVWMCEGARCVCVWGGGGGGMGGGGAQRRQEGWLLHLLADGAGIFGLEYKAVSRGIRWRVSEMG
jgi:hypothetical protein